MPKIRADLDGHTPVLDITHLDQVVAEPLEWIWHRRILKNMLNLLAGDPGMAKSYLSLDIANRISRGLPWPDKSGNAPKGRVLLVSAEDHLSKVIKPRLDKLGADPKMIDYVSLEVTHGDEMEFLALTKHLDQIVEAIHRIRPVLMTVDPLVSFMPGVDSYKDAEVRQMLMRLSKLAEDTKCALLPIMHLNKKPGAKSTYRVGGSIGFVAAARSSMLVGRHPDDPAKFVLAPDKANYSSRPSSISYSVKDDGTDHGRFEWGDLIDISADDMLSIVSPTQQPKVTRAKEFLSSYPFVDGTALSDEVIEAAQATDIGESSLEKAKKSLGITSKKDSDGRWRYVRPEAPK